MKSKELKLDKFITLSRWPVVVFGAIYFFCMIIAPGIVGDWNYVQNVWDRWQGVNVGVLAFAASFIAFEVTRYKESRQSEREFLASRALLPEALSELTAYLKDSTRVHMAAWNNAAPVPPALIPSEYKVVFANCIRHASSDIGEQLSDILVWLQIHTARLEEFIANPPSTAAMKKINALDGLRLVGELQAKVNKLFDFARGMGALDSQPLAWDDYRNAYLNLGLHIEDLVVGNWSLETKTRQHIERSNQ
jgi:hypothetical protein